MAAQLGEACCRRRLISGGHSESSRRDGGHGQHGRRSGFDFHMQRTLQQESTNEGGTEAGRRQGLDANRE